MIVTPSEMRELERIAIAQQGMSSLTLMENAGQAITVLLTKNRIKSGSKVLVLCGSGNNAGDGMVIARELSNRFVDVDVLFCLGRNFTADAKTQYLRLLETQAHTIDYPLHGSEILPHGSDALPHNPWKEKDYDIIVDAILGTGANKPLSESVDLLLKDINSLKACKVALDIPTGIHPGNGTLMAQNPFKADLTLTLQWGKTGLYLSPGRFFVGEVIPVGIGISEEKLQKSVSIHRKLITTEMIRTIFPIRIPWGHKGTFGKVGVLGGSTQYRGAALLSSRSALTAGCGVVFLLYPTLQLGEGGFGIDREVIVQWIPAVNGFHTSEQFSVILPRLNELDALLVGPGLGRNESTLRLVRKVVQEAEVPLVIDADGLTALRGNLDVLKNRPCKEIPLLLTPHLKEFSDLINIPLNEVMEYPVEKAEAFAAEYQCTLVLKSSTTLIATKEGNTYFNSTGNTGLSKGGSGDVLAGLIAGFLPGFADPPESLDGSMGKHTHDTVANYSAILSCFILGKASEEFSLTHWEGSFTPSIALEYIPKILKELQSPLDIRIR